MASLTVIFIVSVMALVSTVTSQETALSCSRCPEGCSGSGGYKLSCHNACKSFNPKFNEFSCENGRCNCQVNRSIQPPDTSGSSDNIHSRFGNRLVIGPLVYIVVLNLLKSTVL